MLEKILREHLLSFINKLDGFTIIDKNGHYLYVSDSWSKAMGYTLEQLKDTTAWELFPDSQSNIAIETGQQIIGHPVKWGKDQISGFTNYYPFYEDDGTIGGCYNLVILAGIENARILQNQIADLSSELEFLKKELLKNGSLRYNIDQIIGSSPKILEMKALIKKVAHTNSSVLIEGETGVGKELVANAVHQLSKRNDQNFVRVNCAAIPPELMESEFFGYEKGAFTGADSKGKIGKFKFADKGSIFLDEVNSLPMHIQPKFLRVLQEHEIEPVGSVNSIPVDIRIIAASNTSLEQEVINGNFREDLYYRLNVVKISVPPLRERKEDIPELVDGLIKKLNSTLGTYVQSVSSSALKLLQQYDWPGNVRELQNALESAITIADSPVLRKDDFYELSTRIKAKKYKRLILNKSHSLQSAKAEFEKSLILEALELCNNNYSQTAKMLDISRTMLYKKIEQYDI